MKRHVAFIGIGQWDKWMVRTFANLGVLRTARDASIEYLDRHPADSAAVRTGLFEESE